MSCKFRNGFALKTTYATILVALLSGASGCKTTGRTQSPDPFMPNIGQVAITELETGKGVPSVNSQYSPPATIGPYTSGGTVAPSIIVPDVNEESGVMLKPDANYGGGASNNSSSANSYTSYTQGWTTLTETGSSDIAVNVPIAASETTGVQSSGSEDYAITGSGAVPYGSARATTTIGGSSTPTGGLYAQPYKE